MNSTLRGAELVAQWRNSAEFDNPAGSLFSGPFAEADIISEPGVETFPRTPCSACVTKPCP
jgi:hypothetical protein